MVGLRHVEVGVDVKATRELRGGHVGVIVVVELLDLVVKEYKEGGDVD